MSNQPIVAIAQLCKNCLLRLSLTAQLFKYNVVPLLLIVKQKHNSFHPHWSAPWWVYFKNCSPPLPFLQPDATCQRCCGNSIQWVSLNYGYSLFVCLLVNLLLQLQQWWKSLPALKISAQREWIHQNVEIVVRRIVMSWSVGLNIHQQPTTIMTNQLLVWHFNHSSYKAH